MLIQADEKTVGRFFDKESLRLVKADEKTSISTLEARAKARSTARRKFAEE